MASFQQYSYLNVLQSFQQNPPGIVHSLTGAAFNPVRESKENLFASNLMPLPPKFCFQERTGRINWRALMNTDLEKIAKEVDLKALEGLLQNITFAQLDRDDLERLGDAHFIKLFRLSQYSIEYLLYTQSYLESLCKTLDVEYKQTYEKTAKTEETIKRYQQELKIMRKELKLKQKTLGTYEYLMKLPVEQEQNVIKCKNCSKFFLSKSYLQKHYQRHHPEVDFHKEFADMPFNNGNDKSLNDRAQSPIKQPQINQEELFNKIKSELFSSLTQNFQKIEQEIYTLKEKQNYKQIQEMLQNYEYKNEEEQRKIQESLQKPAKMLEELKGKWGEMLSQQTSSMKDMIQQSVNDALSKRKEDRDRKKSQMNRSGDISSDGVENQKVKYFEQRVNEFEKKFEENEKIKLALEQKVKEYEKVIQEKGQKLQEEEQRRKEEEQLRREKEQELSKLSIQKQEELKKQQAEEQRIREEYERKLKEEQEKIRQNEEQKRLLQQQQLKEDLEKENQQKLKEQELKLKQQEEEEKQRKIKEQQELEELQKKKKAEEEQLKQKKLQQEQEEQERLKKQKEQEESERQKKLQQEEEAKKKQRQLEAEQEDEDIVIEEEVEEEIEDIDEELKAKQKAREQEAQEKELQEQQKKKLQMQAQKEESKLQGKEEQKKPQLQTDSQRDRVKNVIHNQIKNENFYEGSHATIKSLFKHDSSEVEQKINKTKTQNYVIQNNMLQQEFKNLNIQPVNEKSNPLSTNRKQDLKNVNEMIRGLNRRDTQKIQNSLQKRLSDQTYSSFSERPNSSIGLSTISSNDNLQQKPALKKVKVLCQNGKDLNGLNTPQPLLASSNSHKNINMMKALQQINSLILSTQQSNSSLQSMSILTQQKQQQQPYLSINTQLHTNNTNSGVGATDFKTIQSTKSNNHFSNFEFLDMMPSQTLQQFNLIKSPKNLSQNLLNIPLSSKHSQFQNPTKQKLKQIQQRASGILMQKCESHAALLQSNNHKSQTKNYNNNNHGKVQQQESSLSPHSHQKESSSQRGNSSKVNNRQNSIISNSNVASNNKNNNIIGQQKSLSPHNRHFLDLQSKIASSGQLNEKNLKKSLNIKQKVDQLRQTDKDSQDMNSKSANFNASQENKENKQFQISPSKSQLLIHQQQQQQQFIVQSCQQQLSPRVQSKSNGFKLQLKNPISNKNNLILEQEDYLLPEYVQKEDLQTDLDYSLTKDFQKFVNHDFNMTKNQNSLKKKNLESEESINRGFYTDRQQSSKKQDEIIQMQSNQFQEGKKRKTKGTSYTRNAQELKKLLLETGVIGGLGMTSSLATAAAGMATLTSDHLDQRNNELSKTGKQKTTAAKIKSNEVFCFSARNKHNKQMIILQNNNNNQNTTSLLDKQHPSKRKGVGHHQRVMTQLESSSSIQPQFPSTTFFQTLSQNIPHYIPNYPQSTTNEGHLQDFILKEEDESANNINDDQVIFKSKRDSPKQNLKSVKSPISYYQLQTINDDASQINRDFLNTDTDQFMLTNENIKIKDLQLCRSIIEQQKIFKNQYRCKTTQDDISTEKKQKQFKQNETDQVLIDPLNSEESRFETGAPMSLSQMNLHQQNIAEHYKKRTHTLSALSNQVCSNQFINQQNHQSSQAKYAYQNYLSEENLHDGKNQQNYAFQQQNQQVDSKELEILKFKMIAFVKTYENEFRKMKMQMKELKTENSFLKKKLFEAHKRNLSTANQSTACYSNMGGNTAKASTTTAINNNKTLVQNFIGNSNLNNNNGNQSQINPQHNHHYHHHPIPVSITSINNSCQMQI